MQNRREMEFFIEESSSIHNDYDVEGFYMEDEEHLYAGRNLYMEGNKITYYFFPVDKHQALLFLYIGDNAFDELYDSIDEYNIEAYCNTWPLLMRSFKDGSDDNYGRVALIKLPKVHASGTFWCFATMLENIVYDDMETDYVISKLGKLLTSSLEILNQYIENDISTWEKTKAYGKAGYDGYNKYKTMKSVMKGIGIAASIVGPMFGLDLSSVSSLDS